VNVKPLALYKVVEFDKGVIILNAVDSMMKRPDAHYLIVADFATCGEYLARYCFERAQGKDVVTAHQAALKGARVIQRGHSDQLTASQH